MTDPTFTPPKPKFCFRVGITGHRPGPRLVKNTTPISKDLKGILALIASAARDLASRNSEHYSDEAVELRLVTALADGADRLAAEAAVAQDYVLEAVLPFTADDYARDFAGYSSKRFRDWLQHPAMVSVFALAQPRSVKTDRDAYRLAGEVILDHCDLLIAVWDGANKGKHGGTEDLLSQALKNDLPVVHIDANAENPPLLLSINAGAIQSRDVKAIPELMDRILKLPEEVAYKQFLAEGGSGGAATIGSFLCWRQFGPRLAHLLLGTRYARPQAPLTKQPGWLTATDSISTRLGDVYRSSYTLLYLGSGLAVLLGLVSVFSFDDPWFKAWCVAAELVVIGAIYWLFRRGQNGKWHQRWLDTRRIAEVFRVMAALDRFGAPMRYAKAGDWVSWYVSAIRRQGRLPSVELNAAKLETITCQFLRDTLQSQIVYHRKNANSAKHLHHRLDQLGLLLLGVSIVVSMLFLLLLFSGKVDLHDHNGWFLHWFKPVVTMVTAGLPALGAAFFAIRAQGDYTAAEERSSNTLKRLEEIHATLEQAVKSSANLRTLHNSQSDAANIMLQDVAHWRSIHQHRPLGILG